MKLLALIFLLIDPVLSWKHSKTPVTSFKSRLSKAIILPLIPLFISNCIPVFASETIGKLEYQPALKGLDYGKPRTYYPDFTQKPSGLQYKEVKEGTG